MLNRSKFGLRLHVVIAGVLSLTGCLPAPPPGQNGTMSPAGFVIESVYFFLAIFGVYWMLVLRPSEAKSQEQKKFLDDLKKNDEVVLTGGMYGRVAATSPTFVTVEIAPNVKVKVDPQHVRRPAPEAGDKAAPAPVKPA